jgi:deazaflavin-dependent oxidoreductase (nitroreductase family)
MDEQVQHALAQGGVIDITTRGRHTGQPRRIEIRFHHIEGQVYITGRPPRRRAWYANLLAHPAFTFHLKESLHADLSARATPILEQARRRAIIAAIHQQRGVYQDVEAWVEHSPLVAVEFLVE